MTNKYKEFLKDNLKIKHELNKKEIIIKNDDDFIDYCINKRDEYQLLQEFYHYLLPIGKEVIIYPNQQFKQRVNSLVSDMSDFERLKTEFEKQCEILKKCEEETGEDLESCIFDDVKEELENRNCLDWYRLTDIQNHIDEMMKKIEQVQKDDLNNDNYDYHKEQEFLKKQWIMSQL